MTRTEQVCKFCQELGTKIRPQKEIDRINRWGKPGTEFPASLAKAQRAACAFKEDIQDLHHKRVSVMTRINSMPLGHQDLPFDQPTVWEGDNLTVRSQLLGCELPKDLPVIDRELRPLLKSGMQGVGRKVEFSPTELRSAPLDRTMVSRIGTPLAVLLTVDLCQAALLS